MSQELKGQMSQEAFVEHLLQRAKELGCEWAECHYSKSRSQSVNAERGEIESQKCASTQSLSLRVLLDGKVGVASTENFEEADDLIAHAMENARVNELEESIYYNGGERDLDALAASLPKAPPSLLEPLTVVERAERALQMEEEVKAYDPRILYSAGCELKTSEGEKGIANTAGLRAKRSHKFSLHVASAVAKEGDEQVLGHGWRVNGEALDFAGSVKEACEAALEQLKATSLPSGSYSVVLGPDEFSDLLGVYLPSFYADIVKKGLSPLADKLGQQIASPLLTLVDEGGHEICPLAFDDEGTPCRRTEILKEGKLVSFLHNLETAHHFDVENSGNAHWNGSKMAVAESNLYLDLPKEVKAKSVQVEDWLKSGRKILKIQALEGLHSGTNRISGDFSLAARGQLYDQGQWQQAVKQITVSGNFYQLLKDVEALADDLRWMPSGNGFVALPSVLISSLMVSGEER